MSFMNLRVYAAFESSTILCEILTMFCLISGSVVLFMHCRTSHFLNHHTHIYSQNFSHSPILPY